VAPIGASHGVPSASAGLDPTKAGLHWKLASADMWGSKRRRAATSSGMAPDQVDDMGKVPMRLPFHASMSPTGDG
jgi:hypothetical protein